MKPRRSSSLQVLLLESIQRRYAKKAQAADALMQVLRLNRDGVYRRLRGETSLAPHEIQRLAQYFHISLDQLLSDDPERIHFTRDVHEASISNFRDYLEQLHRHVLTFNQQPDTEVYYATREIPVYIQVMFPRLLAFKLYIYGITNWQFTYLQDRPFDFNLVHPSDLELAQTIAELYCQMNSHDFWNLSILDQTLHQVEYMVMVERIKDISVAVGICDALSELIVHCQSMAERGKKFPPGHPPTNHSGTFDLYYNELVGTNNTILALSDRVKGLYVTFDTPNFIYNTEPGVCDMMKQWFQKVLNHSTGISVHSQKSRLYYFNRLEERVRQTRKRVGLLMEKI